MEKASNGAVTVRVGEGGEGGEGAGVVGAVGAVCLGGGVVSASGGGRGHALEALNTLITNGKGKQWYCKP